MLARYASCYSLYIYLYSGLRPSVREKFTFDNGNLMNLRHTKNIFHVTFALMGS